MRACPNGCVRSGGLALIRKLIKDTICDAASDRLLTPSAVTDKAPDSIPATIFIPDNNRFSTMHTMLTIVPYDRRTAGEPVFS
ncbi:unknown [Clostridium sp. CAG:448]|nr:unknown [Clostridium sp. CAG:448]